MKKIFALSLITGAMFSASVFAATPASYDTKFNVSANVPDSAHITDASGRPLTDLDVELKPAASGFMEATTPALRLWNNDVAKLEVSLILDDGQNASGGAFTLYSTDRDTLSSLSYKINTITEVGQKAYVKSGDSQDFTLQANGTHGELPVAFKFVSDAKYSELGQGNYTGVVYANVNAKA
ncbi:hypothetical protein WN53_03085 [Serratia fonticola]|uniref:hypothetical protein n=1 Tax=Serratia TaxID=613 RepID=UPI0003F58191|nr:MULTISPECIES: hypothetical protein [Serratia]AKG68203.1 hypothetical protein WN53_03085 [Serratia fonticola]AYM91954.1 hypothetical protein D9980_16005 [Serratia sp. 3ACOL1]CAI1953393.1 Uncharacterised protein [Serratia fonticola]